MRSRIAPLPAGLVIPNRATSPVRNLLSLVAVAKATGFEGSRSKPRCEFVVLRKLSVYNIGMGFPIILEHSDACGELAGKPVKTSAIAATAVILASRGADEIL